MIVVTGANGFFGAHLVVAALKAKLAVRALYRETSDMQFIYYLLKFHGFTAKDVTWTKGDIYDPESLAEAFQGASAVIHSAGKVSFAQRDFDALLDVNRDGTHNVVNMALEAGVPKVVYISSIAALESKQYNLEKGGWNAFKKASPYGFSKYLGGLEILRGKEEGLAVNIIYPGVIIGPAPRYNPLQWAWKKLQKGLDAFPGGSTGFTPAMDGAKEVVQQLLSGTETHVSLVADTLPFQSIIAAYCNVFDATMPTKQIPEWKAKWLIRLARIAELLGMKGVTQSGVASLFSPASYEPNPRLANSEITNWFEEIKAFKKA